MKNNVGIFIFDEVDVLDFTGPYEVFCGNRTVAGIESRLNSETAPFDVFTISKMEKNVNVSGGLEVTSDYVFKDKPVNSAYVWSIFIVLVCTLFMALITF